MARDVGVLLPGNPKWLQVTMDRQSSLGWCDLLKAASMHDEVFGVLCGCTPPTSPHRYVPDLVSAAATSVVTGTAPTISSWSEYYVHRGVRSEAPLAVLLSWPLTLYHILVRLDLASLTRPVVVHYLGPEKELLFLPFFRELLALLPAARIQIEMIGPLGIDLPPPMHLEDAWGGSLSIIVRRGLYHALNLPVPDVAFAPNAGLAVEGYAERWPATLLYVAAERIPFVWTDYSEQSVDKGLRFAARCAKLAPSGGVSLNPFRQPLRQPRVCGGSVGLPTLANGFLAAFHTPPHAFRPIASDGGTAAGLTSASSAAPLPIPPVLTVPPTIAAVDLGSFDADAPQPFERFFAVARQLGVVSELQLEVQRRAVQSGRRTARQCMSAHWAQVAYGLGMGQRYAWRCELSEVALAAAPAEVRERAQRQSPRYSGTWEDETSRFSLAHCLAPLITPRWVKLKELGNEALAAGECALAAEWYLRAAALTEHTMALGTFFDVLEESDSRVARRLAQERDGLWSVVHSQLPDCPRRLSYSVEMEQHLRASGLRDVACEPNLPKAICLANAAAARLRQAAEHDAEHKAMLKKHKNLPRHLRTMHAEVQQGLLRRALSDADAAAIACPEYEKAHFRVAQALRALHAASISAPEREADRPNLEQVELRSAAYKLGAHRLPWCGIAALQAGLVHFPEYQLAYEMAYFDHEVRKIVQAQADPGRFLISVTVTASLVPSMGGQNLLLGVEIKQQAAQHVLYTRHDGLCFRVLDGENGERVEKPPHGHASALSLDSYPRPLSTCLADLTSEGVKVDQLCLGQALTDQVDRVAAALKAQPSYSHIHVYASGITHVSKIAVPGGFQRELCTDVLDGRGFDKRPGFVDTCTRR